MHWNLVFVINSILLGVGLAMDAFSVSMANGLGEPEMKPGRMCVIAGVFCGFQFAMPMIGWICVHTIVQAFQVFERFIPWIALALLGYIGGKMLIGGLRGAEEHDGEDAAVCAAALLVQGIATSIDALSVGFTISGYGVLAAAVCAAIIGLVTFVICIAGLMIGKRFGTWLSGKASVLGGVILIAIGLEIFVSGVLG